MRGRPSCLLQFAGGEANRILLASALSSMRIMPKQGKSARLDYRRVLVALFASVHHCSGQTDTI